DNGLLGGNMNLRQLQYFLVLSEELNYHKAAERLFISQPSLSIQIKNLQTELDTKLFLKVGRHIELTKAGTSLATSAKEILVKVRSVEDEMSNYGNHNKDTLKISLSGAHLIYPVLNQFREEFPKTLLSIEELTTNETVGGLLDHSIELGIVFLPIDNPGIDYKFLFNDELIAVTIMTGHYTGIDILSLQELSQLPMVVLNKNYFVRQIMDQAFRKNTLTPDYQAEVNTYQNCLNTLRLTDGVAIVSKSFFESIKMVGLTSDLHVINLTDGLRHQQVAVAYRNDYPLDKITKRLLQLLLETYGH
ncbi:MAG: LysR family transcriptional regulator, partial [Lentilactobacillus parabuchneri]|uniref:LysR family transcriptional regulator n=1 Tax=Lentilactobacillus parabuchneri TaxID=152331 RepID=UPI003F9A245C